MTTILRDKDGIEVFHTPAEADALRQVLQDIPDGNLIEVGVYMGGSAKILAQEHPDRTVYACDTFEGFPDNINTEKGDSNNYYVGQMAIANHKVVMENLKDYKNIAYARGQFPDSFFYDDEFAFAHIDVDTYNSTKDSLEYIYDRMVPGGKILIHDYPAHEGVKRAVDEFMKDKKDKQTVLDTGGRQLLIEYGTS